MSVVGLASDPWDSSHNVSDFLLPAIDLRHEYRALEKIA